MTQDPIFAEAERLYMLENPHGCLAAEDETVKRYWMRRVNLDEVATVFRRCAYSAYYDSRKTKVSGEPQVGTWVFEASTIGGFREDGNKDINAIGILEEIAWENVIWADPDFVWDEAIEGEPHPKEKVYYLRTIDDRRFRWTNATILPVLAWSPPNPDHT